MVSAFSMRVDFWIVVAVAAGTAVFSALCYSLPCGALPPGVLALILGYLWRAQLLTNSVEALLNRLTRKYDLAYHWGIIRWGMRTADEMEPTMVTVLCLLAAVVAMFTAWSVCRKKPILPSMLTAVLCFGTCVVVTDTVPATAWIFLFFFSTLLLILTASVRRQDHRQANRLTLTAAIPVALVLLVVLGLNPRSSYRGQNTANEITDALRATPLVEQLMEWAGLQQLEVPNGNINGVDLTTVGPRNSTNAKVMEVTSSYSGTIYLRGRVMDDYDGKNWTSSGNDYASLKWPVLSGKETVSVSTRFAHRSLYVPYYAQGIRLQGVAVSVENQNLLTDYTFSCSPMPGKETYLTLYPNKDTGLDDETRSQLQAQIQLQSSVQKWAGKLVEKLVGNAQSPYHVAQAIGDYVRASARYDIDTRRMPRAERDFVRWFLEDSDTGYCIHFASAATVLLQAAGLPARYVTGYMVTVEAGQPTPVTEEMAHAWAEYYLPGFGWTVLEATPPDLQQAPSQAQPTEKPTEPTAPGEDSSSLRKKLLSLGWGIGVWSALATVLVVAVAEGQYRLRRWWRNHRLRRAAPDVRAVLYWKQLARLWRLNRLAGDPALFQLVQKAIYSQSKLVPEEMAQLVRAVEAQKALLKRRSIFHRLYYRIVLAVY